MNINPDTLTHVYALAHDSGKVEDGRLAKALSLVPQVVKTLAIRYTDGSRMDEYWVPSGYVVTVRNGHTVSECNCRDSRQRETPYCKHRLSVMLITRAQQIDPESVEATPLTQPVTDDVYRHKMLDVLYPPD